MVAVSDPFLVMHAVAHCTHLHVQPQKLDKLFLPIIWGVRQCNVTKQNIQCLRVEQDATLQLQAAIKAQHCLSDRVYLRSPGL